jgi:hypothetical protein
MSKLQTLLIIATVLLASCSTTQIVEEWHETAYSGPPINSAFVLAVTDKPSERRFYESAMTGHLVANGLNAKASFRLMSEDALSNDAAMIEKAIAESTSDVIITTRVIDITKQTSHAQPGFYYVHHDHRPNFHSYFNPAFHIMLQPGYETTDTIISLETNIYNAKDGSLLWTGHSRSFNPSSIDQTMQELARLMLTKLRQHGFVQ